MTKHDDHVAHVDQDHKAAFLGRMTAGATHELRNVLAIVSESAGLLGDCLDGVGTTGLAPERVQRTLDRIGRQVVRGTNLLGHLNHLAHCPDHVETSVDLNQEAACSVQLNERLARRHASTLQLQQAGAEVPVHLDPLRLQMLLAAALEHILDTRPDGSAVTMQVVAAEAPAIHIVPDEHPEAPAPGTSEDSRHLATLAGSIGARIEVGGQGRLRILFSSEES